MKYNPKTDPLPPEAYRVGRLPVIKSGVVCCGTCGHRVKKGYTFCNHCGQRQKEVAPHDNK